MKNILNSYLYTIKTFYGGKTMRTVTYFNDGWRFYRGTLPEFSVLSKPQTYVGIKTGSLIPVLNHDDLVRVFTPVRLPHDYVILDTPDRRKNISEGFLEGDEAWYLKRFTVDESDKDKQIYLHFEGIAIESEIFLNGTRLCRNFSAYNPITVDITDFVRFDKSNTVVVHAMQAKQPEGWWYQGGGIYRDVKLIKTEKIAVDTFGTYVKPTKRADSDIWDVSLEITVRNDGITSKKVYLKNTVTDENGNCVLRLDDSLETNAKDKSVLKTAGAVTSPMLWDIGSPKLYTLVTEIYDGEERVDEYKTTFGFRTIRFDGKKGFFLNGKSVKIKGICAHQDYGITGIYLPRSVAKYRLELMQSMGCNAYRSAHNLSDENTMNFCDELGILVYDETRYFSSSPEAMSYLETMLRRDRNHPSVITWSIGNEEIIQQHDHARRIAETMTAFIKKFDDRPVTVACHSDGGVENNIISAPVDVLGMNYSIEKHDLFHSMYPDKALVMTESCALQSSRGVYFGDDAARSLFDARDHVINRKDFNNSTRAETWKHVCEREYLAGMFIWAGIEHRGETEWPRLSSQSGLVDLFLQKKEAYFQTMSQYSEKNVLHICPSTWSFEGLEGVEIPVEVYTNCDSVELFLNGESLGRREYTDFEPCRWSVTYTPGTLLAKGYKNGEHIITDIVSTVGEPLSLHLICDTPTVSNDGHDCILYTCVCLDKDGNEVPFASPAVHFSVSGGVLLGTGSSVTDHERPLSSKREMYAGRIALCVHVPEGCEKVLVTAEATGLKSAYASMEFAK